MEYYGGGSFSNMGRHYVLTGIMVVLIIGGITMIVLGTMTEIKYVYKNASDSVGSAAGSIVSKTEGYKSSSRGGIGKTTSSSKAIAKVKAATNTTLSNSSKTSEQIAAAQAKANVGPDLVNFTNPLDPRYVNLGSTAGNTSNTSASVIGDIKSAVDAVDDYTREGGAQQIGLIVGGSLSTAIGIVFGLAAYHKD